MRIALIGTTLFHQGAEFVLATLARGLSVKGHDVTVILSKYQEDWQEQHPDWKPFELPPEVHVVVQPRRRARESVFSFRELIREGRFDVIMCHSGNYTYPLAVATLGMKRRPVLVHVEHSGTVGVDVDGRVIRSRWTPISWMKNLLKRRMDAQFAVSEGTSRAIARITGFPQKRIYTVYNPVLDEVFERKRRCAPRHPWLVEPKIPVIVAAGALCSIKNYSLLLRAFSKVVKVRKARLVIFGEGGEREFYLNLIKELGIEDSVNLPGFTDNLPAELKSASGFVVSSKVESFSVVLVEALASGVPVVSTNCPYGPAEILHSGQYGILVNNNDLDALADGITFVLSGKGVAPRPEMVSQYTVGAVVDRYEQALLDVMSRRDGN